MFAPIVSAIGCLIALTLQSLKGVVSNESIFQFIVNPDILIINLSNRVTEFRQTVPDFWGSSQFDPSRWDHYALIAVFVGIASWGLWLSWCWNQEKRQRKEQPNLTKGSRKG